MATGSGQIFSAMGQTFNFGFGECSSSSAAKRNSELQSLGLEDLFRGTKIAKGGGVDLMFAPAVIPKVTIGNAVSYIGIANKLHISTDEARQKISVKKKRRKDKKKKADRQESPDIESEYDSLLHLQSRMDSTEDSGLDNSRVTEGIKELANSGLSSHTSEYSADRGIGDDMIRFRTFGGVIQLPIPMIKISRLPASTVGLFLAKPSRAKTSSSRFYDGLLKKTTPKPVVKIARDVVAPPPKPMVKIAREIVAPLKTTKKVHKQKSKPIEKSNPSENKKRRIHSDSDDAGEGLVWVQPNKPVPKVAENPKKAAKVSRVKEVKVKPQSFRIRNHNHIKTTKHTLNGSKLAKTNGRNGYTDEEVLAMIKPKSVADMPRIPKKSESVPKAIAIEDDVPETLEMSMDLESPDRSLALSPGTPLPSVPDLLNFFGPCAETEETDSIRLLADPVEAPPVVPLPTTPDDEEDFDILNIHAEEDDFLF